MKKAGVAAILIAVMLCTAIRPVGAQQNETGWIHDILETDTQVIEDWLCRGIDWVCTIIENIQNREDVPIDEERIRSWIDRIAELLDELFGTGEHTEENGESEQGLYDTDRGYTEIDRSKEVIKGLLHSVNELHAA